MLDRIQRIIQQQLLGRQKMVMPSDELRKVGEDGEDDFKEKPPIPPRGGRLDMGGGLGKTVVVSLIVTMLVLLFMSVAGRGGFFVNKSDFTANMVGVVAAMEQAEAGLVKAKADVTVALQNIPNTLSAQVTASVAQSVGQWNSQLSSLSDRVSTLSGSIGSIPSNTTKVNQVIADIAALESNIATLLAQQTDMLARIEVLETTSGTSDGSGTSADVAISSTSHQADNIYSATGTYYFTLAITNNTNVLKKVYLQAVMTPSASASVLEPVDVTSANFSVSGVLFTSNGSFETYLIPPSGVDCLRVEARSNGYLTMLAPGTMTVVVTLNYVADTVYVWDMSFSPIVTAY